MVHGRGIFFGYSLSLALEEPSLKACEVYYGRLVTDRKKLSGLQCPILGFFGEEDRGISPESVRQFEKTLKELGKNVQVFIYPKAGHAFANPARESYRAGPAEEARRKAAQFFAQNLK